MAKSSLRKIHFHSDLWYFGGSERMIGILIEELQKTGNYEISMSFRKSKRYLAELQQEIKNIDFPIYQIFTAYPNYFKYNTDRPRYQNPFKNFINEVILRLFHYVLFFKEVVQFALILKKVKPDIVHLNNGGYPGARSVRAAAVASKICKIDKIIMVVNNIAKPYSSLYRLVDYPLDKLVANSVTTFVTSSERAKNKLTEVLKPNSKVLKIQNVVKHVEIAKYTHASNDKINIVAVGNLEKRKGHLYLIEAISKIKIYEPEIYENVIVWIMGSGKEKKYLEKTIEFLKIEEVVNLIPYESNLKYINLISIAQLFVHPSIGYEDSPNVVTTALGLGKPIIATDVGGVGELVKDGINGSLIEPMNSDAIYHAIKSILKNRKLLEIFSTNSRKIFEDKIELNETINKYLAIYGD